MKKGKNEILGRGLSALISDETSYNDEDIKEHNLIYIDINTIDPNPYQPRTTISLASIVDLSNSIKKQGLILPVTVARSTMSPDRYTLVAGERRLKASKMAGFKKIPALLRDIDPQGMAELALVENVHRKDLNPMEEAYAIYNLIGEFNQTMQQISEKLAKSLVYVRNKLMLVKLPDIVQSAIASEEITERHGRILHKLHSEEAMVAALKIIIRDKLTIEKTLKLVSDIQEEKNIGQRNVTATKIWQSKYSFVKEDISNLLGYPTKLRKKRNAKGGSVIIDFSSDKELLELHKKLLE